MLEEQYIRKMYENIYNEKKKKFKNKLEDILDELDDEDIMNLIKKDNSIKELFVLINSEYNTIANDNQLK